MRWLVLVAWMALIAYWSNQPNLPIDSMRVADALHNMQHRVAHLIAFGLMGLLAWWATDRQPRSSADKPVSARVAVGRTSSQTVASDRGRPNVRCDELFGHGPRAILLAIAITSAFGATDEVHQSFISGRRAAIDDWLLDTLWAAVAIAVLAQLRKTKFNPAIRAMSPALVALAFAAGIGLALRPALSSALALLKTL